MRKIPLQVPALAAIAVCVLAGCWVLGQFTGNGSGAGSGGGSARTGSGLFMYAPSWLRPGCSETGTSGHFPASVSGYSASLTCTLRVNMPAEVDYYRYATTRDMKAAYASASASDHPDPPQRPGGCAMSSNENGKWSVAGVAVGDIACSVNGDKQADLVWDDPHTDIIAVASSRYLLLANLYAFWQSSGASIAGSSRSATIS